MNANIKITMKKILKFKLKKIVNQTVLKEGPLSIIKKRLIEIIL